MDQSAATAARTRPCALLSDCSVCKSTAWCCLLSLVIWEVVVWYHIKDCLTIKCLAFDRQQEAPRPPGGISPGESGSTCKK